MLHGKTVLAFIPARGGSKSIPRKNVRLLAGLPLIQWTILAAKQSTYVDRVVVSSDDPEILRIAAEGGAQTPFVRPAELASDDAQSEDALIHAMRWYETHERPFDFAVYLQPTSPLRTAQHIDEACELIEAKQADGVVSVCRAEHSPLWCNVLPPDGNMKDFIRQGIKYLQRQQLPTYYRLNGAVHVVRWGIFRATKDWYGEKTYAYVMDAESSVDIDTPLDFQIAEAIIMNQRKPQSALIGGFP